MLGRLKFEVDALAEQMLDNIPSEIFESNTTTFLDPAMGGGQFLKAVIARLRKYGHSDTNIAGRVFGYETNKMRVNFVAKQCNNVGTFAAKDFLEEDMSKKFDVVIGNPPYQETKEHGKKVTGNGALWVRFTELAFNTTKDNGVVAFVIPDSVLAPTYDKMGSRVSLFNDLFKKFNTLYLNLDVKKFFQNVGTYPIAFVCQKNNLYKETKIQTKTELFSHDIHNMNFIPKDYNKISISIHNKILSNKENDNLFKMRWIKEVTSLNAQDEKTEKCKYPVIDGHSFKEIRWSENKDPDFDKPKVLVTYVGNYQCIVDNGNRGAKQTVSIRFLTEGETTESADSFYNSNLINYVMNSNKWTQYLLSQILNRIPHPPLDRVYTNKEIYEYFNLEQEEIDYIETNVK